MLPAVPLKVVRAFGSLNLQAVTIVFDQFVDPTSATDPFNYTVAGFGIDPNIVLNSDGQSVTLKLDAVQAPGANYCVEVSGVLSGAQLELDPNPSTVCYQTFVVTRLEELVESAKREHRETGRAPGEPRRITAWPEVAVLVVSGLAFLGSFLV